MGSVQSAPSLCFFGSLSKGFSCFVHVWALLTRSSIQLLWLPVRQTSKEEAQIDKVISHYIIFIHYIIFVNLMTNHYKQDSSRSCTFKIMLNESPMNQKVFDWNSKHGRFKGKLIFRLGRRKRRQTLSLCSFIAVPGRYSIC